MGALTSVGAPSAHSEDGPPPVSPLLGKLLAKTPVTYLALGDSITYGMGVADPAANCYTVLFHRALSEQFGHPSIKLLNCGDPGVTIGKATEYAGSHLATTRPDLVTIQYGGNDARVGTDARAFREKLRSVAATATRRTTAETLLCVPPLEDKFSDAEVRQGIYTVARSYALPVADLESALKRELPEFRGPFPWGEHPERHAHAVMARELYDTLANSLGLPRSLSVRLERGARLAPADGETVELVAKLAGTPGSRVATRLLCGGKEHEASAALNETGEAVAAFPIARNPGAMVRTGTARAWCSVQPEEGREGLQPYDFDVAWLSVAPVLPVGDGRALGLDRSQARIGAAQVADAADLSAVVTARRTFRDDVVVTVDVTDDKLSVDNAGGPYENDCVELFLDVRSDEERGAPYYSTGVALIFVVPAPGNSRVTWISQKPMPSALAAATVETRWREGGYLVELRLPGRALVAPNGDALDSLGFDVAVDDSDNGKNRQTQLMWAGTTRNHLIPSEFGALDLRPEPAAPSVRITVH